MAILKNKTQGRFVIVSIAPLQDPNLSTKERGLLCTIMSLPDNWNFSVRGLTTILPDGRESLSNSIQLLEGKGYLTRQQGRTENGGFGGNIIEVHEYPIIGGTFGGERFEKTSKNPSTGNPYTDNPLTGNPTGSNIKEFNNINNNIYINQSGITVTESEDLSSLPTVASLGMTGVQDRIPRDDRLGNDGDDGLDVEEAYKITRREIRERISYDALVHDYPGKMDTIDLIMEILIAVENNEQETLRIGGEPKPIEVVRTQMRKLDMFHVQYVLDGLESAGRIRNPTAYLLTSLYRSVFTMQMHVDNQFRSDMRENPA